MSSTLVSKAPFTGGFKVKRLNLGAAFAIGIGTGAALAASMGSAGYALGLGLWLAIHGIGRLRRIDGR